MVTHTLPEAAVGSSRSQLLRLPRSCTARNGFQRGGNVHAGTGGALDCGKVFVGDDFGKGFCGKQKAAASSRCDVFKRDAVAHATAHAHLALQVAPGVDRAIARVTAGVVEVLGLHRAPCAHDGGVAVGGGVHRAGHLRAPPVGVMQRGHEADVHPSCGPVGMGHHALRCAAHGQADHAQGVAACVQQGAAAQVGVHADVVGRRGQGEAKAGLHRAHVAHRAIVQQCQKVARLRLKPYG